MPISPIGIGDGRPQHWTFTTDSGIFSLATVAGSAITQHTRDIGNDNALYVCTGAWTITDGANGKADFSPSVADCTTGYLGRARLYDVYPVVILASGPVPMDAQRVQVVDEL